MKCQICLRKFQKLRFQSADIRICKFCVGDINDYREIASYAHDIFSERLRKGMHNRLDKEMQDRSNPTGQRKAMSEYNNFGTYFEKALPDWLNKMASEEKISKEYKILRAYRRGLIHLNRPKQFDFPSDWEKRTRIIRKREKLRCADCGATDVKLDVHHIIYRSNFGTDRKANLIALCRPCHEAEHGRNFDAYEDPLSFTEKLRDQVNEKEIEATKLSPSPKKNFYRSESSLTAIEVISEATHKHPEMITLLPIPVQAEKEKNESLSIPIRTNNEALSNDLQTITYSNSSLWEALTKKIKKYFRFPW